MTERSPELYIDDIIEAINKIERYTKDMDFSKFSENELVLDTVILDFYLAESGFISSSKLIAKSGKTRDLISPFVYSIFSYFPLFNEQTDTLIGLLNK